MEVNELMIGDWVQITHHHNPKPIVKVKQVDLIDFRNALKQIYPRISYDPIRITPEILEKNGFVLREGCTSAWDWHSNDYSVHVSGNNDQVPMNITIYVPTGWSPHGSSRLLDDLSVRYIHKLQHALRLAGIKKEIVL